MPNGWQKSAQKGDTPITTSNSYLNNSSNTAQQKVKNMQTISQVTETLLNGINANPRQSQGELVNRNGSQPQSRSSQTTQQQGAGQEESDVKQFTLALGQACIALKQYGKTPAELLALRDMFLTVLGDIAVRELTKALFIHLNRSDDIPTPKQLREIIYPPPPKVDWALYAELKKRLREGNVYVSRDEKQYLCDCEATGVDRMKGEMENYQNAKNQIQSNGNMLITQDF